MVFSHFQADEISPGADSAAILWPAEHIDWSKENFRREFAEG
jgi:hypothetical protein